MTDIGEFEAVLMATGERDASTGMQMSQVRSTHRSDGSFVSPDTAAEDTLLEALGLTDERRERIMRLKAAIAGGRYYVSASDVAERLMMVMLAD